MAGLRTALVTGGHGFLGRHVARAFHDAGWKVVALGHGAWSDEEMRRWGISLWHSAEISTGTLATYAGEVNTVVHCAGSGQVGFSLTHPLEDFQRTAVTTAAALEFIRTDCPNADMIFISSAAVYGESSDELIAEQAPLAPISPYGVHKLVAERLCRSYADTYGMRVRTVRFFSLYGPWLRKQLLWDACNRLAAGTASFAGNGNELRDWIHVSDAARLVFRLAQAHDSVPDVVNGGTGSGATVRDLLTELAHVLGTGSQVTFTGQQRSGNPHRLVADNSRARALGWSPKYQWREGIREYVDWYKAQV